jgi:hypothetical protein
MILFMVTDGIELHWVIGYVQKISPLMLPPAFNTVVAFTRILWGRTNQKYHRAQ